MAIYVRYEILTYYEERIKAICYSIQQAAKRGGCSSLYTVDISELKNKYNYALNKSGATILKASKGVSN
jgi:hypothetical protein